jgi:hypothetical protein
MKLTTLPFVLLLAAFASAQVSPQWGVKKTTNTNTNTNTNSSSSNATGGAGGNGGNASNGPQSQSSTYNENIPRQTAMAYAPDVFSTANCFKGFSGGASSPVAGISFGAGKIDGDCNLLRIAHEFIVNGNVRAAAKLMCATKAAKNAGLTADDCTAFIPAPIQVTTEAKAEPPAPIIVPSPQVTVNVPPAVVQNVPVTIPQLVSRPVTVKKRKPCPCKAELEK